MTEHFGLPDSLSVPEYLEMSVRDRAKILKRLSIEMFGKGRLLKVISHRELPSDPAWVPILESLLSHEPDLRLQESIAMALGRVQSRDAIPALLVALRSSNPTVQWWGAWGVGAIGAGEAIPYLAPLLRGNSRVREVASDALIRIGQTDGLVVLREAAEDLSGDSREVLMTQAERLSQKLSNSK